MRKYIMPSIYEGPIYLSGPKSDLDGEKICCTEVILVMCTDAYDYWRTEQGVFRRSVNYWNGSPYGYNRVLPCHVDRWGLPC